jgi:AcrR family transcriptional regulator
MPGPKTSYHHGDLTRALVAVATEMAEEGGPDAVVLREAARRTGVSATAAYRHFEGQEDLLAHVAASAMADLSQWIQTAQARVPDGRDPRRRAIARWRAAGDAYVRFALAHPGLFRTAFSCIGQVALPMRDGRPEADPYQLLCDSLDDCVEVGALTPEGACTRISSPGSVCTGSRFSPSTGSCRRRVRSWRRCSVGSSTS